MGSLSTALYPEPLRLINSATLAGSYLPVGTPFVHPIRLMKMTNNSNVDVTVSWDGVTDHEILVAGSFLLIDVSSNKEAALAFDISQNTQLYVRGASGAGNIYVSAYYGK
jgi:hypothetical protein